ncbi:MAG: hypothetical protein IJX46_02230 [Clostridia bacterium]|nr:hypothetical protein [Clostridia bacterium]
MNFNNLNYIIRHFAPSEINLIDENNVEIINPNGLGNIYIDYSTDDEDYPYIVRFSFQHCHVSDAESALDYANDIISGNICAIEFFSDGKNAIGGDITSDELKELTYEMLERKTGYYGSVPLKEIADSFKVRGWKSDGNFDANFVLREDGSVDIKIIR